MVEKVGEEAWWLHHVIGPWDMAAEVRGLVNLSMDIYDRPQFVHDLMRLCTDWLKGFYKQLGQTGIHSISMNETWVGVGVARQHFLDFMQPYETECVRRRTTPATWSASTTAGARRCSSRTSPTPGPMRSRL